MGALALAALAAWAVWVFGSGLARFAGAVLILVSLLRLATHTADPRAFPTLAAGMGLWLAGHWLWAIKHKLWRSQLALNIYSLPGLHHLAPIATNHTRRPSKWAPERQRES
ncbi:hypothetical protein CBI38_36825 (plasmid) [Rhodococcus oxybenzonivorans]|uniref:Uncharacterized protein n=1 Tax=Rhodococcus oxybenzonivorans TaxID=1990687 RepID=A0A2S2C809_9NOCA|nr:MULTISPECIES: hypothetical protein [Rhodococcus]AWK76974.1 hypothetical protein CBI38_36825 [Rhodococcus oxybenzonivorans]QTJ71278.1 hypothetical protein HYG77_38180 [Rhodococcus sp. ZPP]